MGEIFHQYARRGFFEIEISSGLYYYGYGGLGTWQPEVGLHGETDPVTVTVAVGSRRPVKFNIAEGSIAAAFNPIQQQHWHGIVSKHPRDITILAIMIGTWSMHY